MELFDKVKQKFPFLPDEKLTEMLSLGELRMLNAGEAFVEIGQRSKQAALVIEGMLRNYVINDNGEQVTVVFATEFQSLAPYASVFLDRPASETTEAVEPTILFVIDYNVFKSRAETDPIYMRVYMEIIQEALIAAIERVEDFTNKKPEQRYQRLLDSHGFLIERAPLKYVASYLGITPVSLSRIRKRLAKSRN